MLNNPKKIILAIVILVILGIAYWLISPLFINKKVNETFEDIMKMAATETPQISEPIYTEPQVIIQGTFEGKGSHSAQGAAKLVKAGSKYFIRFEEDFHVTNGPDLYVYLGKNDHYEVSTKISSLKGNMGGQNYEVPENIKVSEYNEVWIWCRAFSVPFGKATLK